MSTKISKSESAMTFRWPDPDPLLNGDAGCRMIFCVARIDNRSELACQFSLESGLSSSEMILQLYQVLGADCANCLLGDFAFAIWDPSKHHIYAARDFMGCQPVYYWHDRRSMMMADNIEQLIDLIGEYPLPDEPYVAATLARVFTDHERTHFADIKKIPPAHYLIATQDTCETFRYWRAEDISERRWSSHEACLAEFRGIIKQAVRDRLPEKGRTGVHVSGGLDCSSLSVLAAEELREQDRQPPAALTWYPPPAPDHTEEEKGEYERIYAVCEKAGIEPIFTSQTVQNIYDVLRRDNWKRPICNASYNERLVQIEAQKMGASLIISGFGGDEGASFNGRGYLQSLALTGRWLKLAKFADAKGIGRFRFCAAHLVNGLIDLLLSDRQLTELKNEVSGVNVPLRKALANVLNPFSKSRTLSLSDEQQKLRNEGLPYLDAKFQKRVEPMPPFTPFRYTSVKNVQCALLQWSMITARMESWAADGARFGIKYAYPLLDRRVVEFALSLPDHVFIDGQYKRLFFRQAMAPFLPASVCWHETKSDPARSTPVMKSFKQAFVSIGRQLAQRGIQSPKTAYIDMDRLLHDLATDEVAKRDRMGRLVIAMEFLGTEYIPDPE